MSFGALQRSASMAPQAFTLPRGFQVRWRRAPLLCGGIGLYCLMWRHWDVLPDVATLACTALGLLPRTLMERSRGWFWTPCSICAFLDSCITSDLMKRTLRPHLLRIRAFFGRDVT